ncbi:MAG: hypothetical protein P8O70_00165 [SAR324 cluster bacterium]|nr:hypothetical protein [SAR324 cluster bacterium]
MSQLTIFSESQLCLNLPDGVVKYQRFEPPINISTVNSTAWDLTRLQAQFMLGRQHRLHLLQSDQLPHLESE